MTRFIVNSRDDVANWVASMHNVNDEQAELAAIAIWQRPDFPHPVNNSDLGDYLDSIPEDYVYTVAGRMDP